VLNEQGEVDRALELWQRSLAIAERTDHASNKAAALNNIAGVIAKQGEIDRALDLWQQSLEISESISDIRGRDIAFNQMAEAITEHRNPERTLELWERSLEIAERIAYVKGKASILCTIANIVYEQGDTPRSLELLTQSARAAGQAGADANLVTVLGNLDIISEPGDLTYLAQATWLCLRVEFPLKETLSLFCYLFDALGSTGSTMQSYS